MTPDAQSIYRLKRTFNIQVKNDIKTKEKIVIYGDAGGIRLRLQSKMSFEGVFRHGKTLHPKKLTKRGNQLYIVGY